MFSKVFLAQTYREMEQFPQQNTAYMACHFSPYSKGLSNIPPYLPKGSILLLDEATSALDEATEVELLNNIKKLGKTCIVVSHRSRVKSLCDRVVVLNQGACSESQQ